MPSIPQLDPCGSTKHVDDSINWLLDGFVAWSGVEFGEYLQFVVKVELISYYKYGLELMAILTTECFYYIPILLLFFYYS